MSGWLFKTSDVAQRYKDASALLLKHKQGEIHLSEERLKNLKRRRSRYGLVLRMLKTSAKHYPLISFYEDQRVIALSKYSTKKRAAVAATKVTVEKFKVLSSSQVRAIIKAYR